MNDIQQNLGLDIISYRKLVPANGNEADDLLPPIEDDK